MISARLTNRSVRGFAGLNFSRKPVSKNLEKYDVLVVGANSGALFSRHFDQVAHGHYSMMVICKCRLHLIKMSTSVIL